MFQIGALAALEDARRGPSTPTRFDLYVGSSSGASVAAALAGGLPVQRIYRAFLDPADIYFGLERKHLLRDRSRPSGGARCVSALVGRCGTARQPRSLAGRRRDAGQRCGRSSIACTTRCRPGSSRSTVTSAFSRTFFVRRGVPNTFRDMPRPLRILAHDLDSASRCAFGAPGSTVPVTRACIASMAIPPFFSPVRIGDRHYINPGAGQVAHLDVAVDEGADVIVVVNPMVPVRVEQRADRSRSARQPARQGHDVGAQSGDPHRHAALVVEACERAHREPGRPQVLLHRADAARTASCSCTTRRASTRAAACSSTPTATRARAGRARSRSGIRRSSARASAARPGLAAAALARPSRQSSSG